ncbi:MAG: hypothetical protein NXI25_26405, partial [bacterium]|nr:hypothetical protein [bacterium]
LPQTQRPALLDPRNAPMAPLVSPAIHHHPIQNHSHPGGGRGWRFYLFHEMTMTRHTHRQRSKTKTNRSAPLVSPAIHHHPTQKPLQSWRGSGVEILPFSRDDHDPPYPPATLETLNPNP